MFSIWLSLLIVQSINIIIATSLRCNEDINGSFHVIENCRSCVIFIAPATLPTTSTTTKTTILSKNIFTSYGEPSLEELFLFGEAKRHRHRRRRNVDTIIHQQCARELDGPLYGYDQTHCYCNSNQCNSNIQRCIYEVTSKRHFACYHGSNSSVYPLEIRHKCRSCRILTEFNSIYHYECLTFGEREQNNRTHCTCQRPMCNQDISTCQRFQQAPSQPRLNLALDILLNSTISITTTIITTTITTTTISTSTSTIKISSTTTTAAPPPPPTTTTTTTTATTMTTTTAKTATTNTTTSSSSMTTTDTTASTSTTGSTASSTTLTTTLTTLTTTSTIVTTTSFVTTTPITTTLPAIIETEEEISIENSTIIELTSTNEITTSFNEIQHLKTMHIEAKNHANYLSSIFLLICTLFQTFFFFLFIRCDH
ncbi:unnamed protein product [Rotaria sp. Silwood2]|nr:unnamed protein product [Rotaria sp. Silwood2]CAF3960230.1 unnamed protein product [Rotaria sp. Silwood2]